jgi:hypothetical protein
VEGAVIESGRLEFHIALESLAGHKFPTAYPSRRAWLHVTVAEESGRIVFESGALRADGRITGNDNDDDGARFEPHYRSIESPGEVQIYEAVLADPDGSVTTGLLTATGFLKDNRILPRGFDKTTADADIAVHGDALTDGDFTAGGDRVRYSIALADAAGPLRIEARLLFQPIGWRWATNLADYRAVETDRFVEMFRSMADVSATFVATATATVR